MSLDQKRVPFHFSMPLLISVLSICWATQLTGCAPLVLGGAALAGKVALDRRTAGIQLEDEAIEFRSESGLRGQLPKSVRYFEKLVSKIKLLKSESGLPVYLGNQFATISSFIFRPDFIGVSISLSFLGVETVSE